MTNELRLLKKLSKEAKHVDKEEVITTVFRIAISGSTTHETRRSEIIRTVKTLDQLTKALKRERVTIYKDHLYTSVSFPKNGKTREGKQHVTTAPVKLTLANSLKHQSHPHTKFAGATINTLEELDGLLGPGDVNFHSQDDKTKVTTGLVAA